MSETTTDAAEVADDETRVVSESTADNTTQTDEAAENAEATDWQAKYEAERKIRQDWEKKAKRSADPRAAQLAHKVAELQAKLEGREKEFAAEQAALAEKRKVEAEALAKANARILKAEIRAAAASKLADPNDALRFIDLDGFEVGDDGEVDRESITAAIEELVNNKPYLAAQGGTNSGPVFESPSAHRKGEQSQLTRDDIKNMTPDQINAARAEGRLNDLLGIKN